MKSRKDKNYEVRKYKNAKKDIEEEKRRETIEDGGVAQDIGRQSG